MVEISTKVNKNKTYHSNNNINGSESDESARKKVKLSVNNINKEEDEENNQTKVALLGFPCDIGVQRNGGDIGARNAPNLLRKNILARSLGKNPEFNVDLGKISLVDRGNVNVSDSLEESHALLVSEVAKLCRENDVTIVIGGGHDQSYPVAKGLMNSLQSGRIGVVNVDAHLDVRPMHDGVYAHSGSPFRQLLEDLDFKGNGSFWEFGVQGSQCSKDHTNYVQSNGGKVKWLSELGENEIKTEFKSVLNKFEEKETFVSICIDVMVGSDCPGVNLPGLNGFSAEEAFDVCFIAGQHPHTKLLDISEFNPSVESQQTTQLITDMIYYFLMGVSARSNAVITA